MEELTSQEPTKRPTGLTVLGILTFIYTGFSLFGVLFSFVKGPMTEDELLESQVAFSELSDQLGGSGMSGFADTMNRVMDLTARINEYHYILNFLNLIALVLGILGVIYMWKLKKLGFHMYIVYSLLLTFSMYFFISPAEIPTLMVLPNLIISLIFVGLYAMYLKRMKA